MKIINLSNKSIFVFFLCLFVHSFSLAQDSKKAEKLLNEFMKAMTLTDYDESAKEVAKLCHKSLLNDNGELTKDIYSFSFKKAYNNSKYYQNPVKIVRVRAKESTYTGYGENKEEGKIIDYFIGRKNTKTGMPAPVQVFFPSNGDNPSLVYLGNL